MSNGKTATVAATTKAWTGQPAAEHRRIVNGILWLHTGALVIFQQNAMAIGLFPVGSIGGEKQGFGGYGQA